MPRRPDVPCAGCGRLMWRGTGSRPTGEATCQACRRKRSANPTQRCADCGGRTSNMRVTRCSRCAHARTSARRGGWRQHVARGGTADQRGYDARHRQERARWAPVVAAGRGICQQGLAGNGSSGTCVEPNRWIKPGSRWALGHTDDRTGWIGPVHHRCNLIDAASRGGKARAAKYGPYRGQSQGRSPSSRLPVGH